MSTTRNKPRTKVSGKQKPASVKKNATKTNGSVMLPGEILPVQEFMERVGTTRRGIAGMRNRGLITRKDGQRVVIRYDDYAEYVKNLPPA